MPAGWTTDDGYMRLCIAKGTLVPAKGRLVPARPAEPRAVPPTLNPSPPPKPQSQALTQPQAKIRGTDSALGGGGGDVRVVTCDRCGALRPPKRGGKPLSWTCDTCIGSHEDAYAGVPAHHHRLPIVVRAGGQAAGRSSADTSKAHAPAAKTAKSPRDWPRDGEQLEVEAEVSGGVVRWVPAVVLQLLVDGSFQARVQVPGDPFEDWFTWQDEGTDWRRPKAANLAKARKTDYASTRCPVDDSADGSGDDPGRRARRTHT